MLRANHTQALIRDPITAKTNKQINDLHMMRLQGNPTKVSDPKSSGKRRPNQTCLWLSTSNQISAIKASEAISKSLKPLSLKSSTNINSEISKVKPDFALKILCTIQSKTSQNDRSITGRTIQFRTSCLLLMSRKRKKWITG